MILYDLTFIREAIINDNNLQDDKYYSINKYMIRQKLTNGLYYLFMNKKKIR